MFCLYGDFNMQPSCHLHGQALRTYTPLTKSENLAKVKNANSSIKAFIHKLCAWVMRHAAAEGYGLILRTPGDL